MIRHVFVFFCLIGFLAWFPMAYYLFAVGREFARAKIAGEVPDVGWPSFPGGVPVVILFTDRLPAIRTQRYRFIFWFCIFFGSVAAGSFVATAFGPKW
jgi:hypothetical protein